MGFLNDLLRQGRLALLWMLWLRSSRSEQARFARVAAALRAENLALGQSMHALGLHLADAQKQLGEQARIVQQLGLDTVMRLGESSDKLAGNASVIANAHDQLARSGDVALQRMDGLLAGLPRIDDVAQRLAVNFREAGLVAHQQGASLEAKLAALGEEAARTAQAGQASTEAMLEAIVALQEQAKEAEIGLLAASAQMTAAHDAALARVTEGGASARDEMTATLAAMTGQIDDGWRRFREGVNAAAAQMDTPTPARRWRRGSPRMWPRSRSSLRPSTSASMPAPASSAARSTIPGRSSPPSWNRYKAAMLRRTS